MSFDKATRNALARMVGQARERLKSDVMDQLRRLGFQADGTVLELTDIAGLSETEREAGIALRDQLAHFISLESGSEAAKRQAAYDRLAREIGFTTLNRLVALRMAEERGLVVESVGKGLASVGFQIYERVARDALGARAETYRAYLELLYDELALDLPLLFDRTTPESHIFPGERCLEETLALLNDPALAHLWKEDEAIGWVYQYYNDPAERKKMRDASQAPRNSRELAVRNQFFTPRYVVEFLTDNTLGRIWYEMRGGETRLADDCQYLVRRKHPIWLPAGQSDLYPFAASSESTLPQDSGKMWTRPNPAFEVWDEIQRYALTVEGYTYAQEHGMGEAGDLANSRLKEYRETGAWYGSFEELRICLFFEQRRWRHFGKAPEGDDLKAIQALYKALCEAWDREADVIVYRQKKDPRDLKVLDPACGSGHFLLYSFDLLATIYEEAWEDERGPVSEVTGARLRTDYSDLDTLRRAIPGLILRHNLHGVDIDPRACQIAGLALWLRAQRAYQRLGLKATERPLIEKGNIVCAEPMPGERALLHEFVSDLKPRVLGQLVEVIFDRMQLAGEAGTLLKIENEVTDAVAEAKKQWQDAPQAEQTPLWPEEKVLQPSQPMLFDVGDISDESFWYRAEKLVIAALHDYAAQATNSHATQRRLFREDAEQGFAFIDLSRQQFDVVLMNPPFGSCADASKDYIDVTFPRSKHDLAAVFVERWMPRVSVHGIMGALTTRTPFFLAYLESWRTQVVLNECDLRVFADLGDGVLEAIIETCAYTLTRSGSHTRESSALFFRLTSDADKGQKLADALSGRNEEHIFSVLPKSLGLVPGAPFSYWTTSSIRRLFATGKPVESNGCVLGHGAATTDNERFLRLDWEVPTSSKGRSKIWVPISKGGEYAPFFTTLDLVIKWERDARELKSYISSLRASNGWSAHWTAVLNSYDHYFQPGITWPTRPHTRGSFAVLPPGLVFTHSGMALLGEPERLLPRLAVMNSQTYLGLLSLLMPRGTDGKQGMKYELGYIRKVPLPERIDSVDVARSLATLSKNAVNWTMAQQSYDETTRYFTRPHVMTCQPEEGRLSTMADKAIEQEQRLRSQLMETVRNIDVVVRDAYGLDTDDVQSLEQDIVPHGRMVEGLSSLSDLIARVVSWLLGSCYGRWDIRIDHVRTGVRLPTVFSPLPACAPGTLVGPDGLPATLGHIVSEEWLRARPDAITPPPAGSVQRPTIADDAYPIRIAWDGILVDDPEHPADIVRRVREALAVLWPGENGARAEAIEREACEILGVRELRDYFRKPADFFEDHLKRYSKSRRQAPIYWPLSTASGSYTLWVYYHRLTSDTLYTAVNRYVEPKLAEARRRLADDERELEGGASGREGSRLRASVEQGQAFLRELREFRDELLRVAALPYQPDLNDGVIITAAPLHRLFRLPRWGRDTKATWEKLERGDYDWAHLAYTLWPDRVREKCRTDKSLAIAHGLEALYVEPPATAKRGRVRKAAASGQDELASVAADEDQGEE